MGVFYRTDKSQYIDYIVKLPEELMLKAVDFYNKGVSGVKQAAVNFLQKQYQTFPFAQEDLNRYYEEKYGKPIQDILNEIYTNPDSWKRLRQELQNIGYNLVEDEMRGQIAKWTRPYQEYLQKAQEYADLVKKGKYSEEAFNLWNLYALQRAKENYSYENGNVNLNFINEMGLPETKNATEFLEKQFKNKFGQEGYELIRDTATGQFILRSKTGYEQLVDPNRIYETSMRMLGFAPVYNDNGKIKDWQMAELTDVGKYYWNKAYWSKYLQAREEGLSMEQAREKAVDYANKLWASVASNTALAMAQQFKSGKYIDDQMILKELSQHTARAGRRSGTKEKENIPDYLGGTLTEIDVIPDEYFNRDSVDKWYSKYYTYFNRPELILKDTETFTEQELSELNNAFYTSGVSSTAGIVDTVEKLYSEGKISWDSYKKFKDKWQTYSKYKSAYNASKNYALSQVGDFSFRDKIYDIYGPNVKFVVNGEEVEDINFGKIVEVINSGGYIDIVYRGENLQTHKYETFTQRIDANTIANGETSTDEYLRTMINKYNSYRDEWFKNNRDAGKIAIYALDISTIDGNNFRLSKRLGRRIFTSSDVIQPVDLQRDMAAPQGDYAAAANKVLKNLKSVYSTVKIDDNGNITFQNANGSTIASFITIKKVFTLGGEQYITFYVNKDQKIYDLLGLSKKEIKALEEKGNTITVHIPSAVDVRNDVLGYMKEYGIQPNDTASKYVISLWLDPARDIRDKAYKALYRLEEREDLGMESYASVTLPTRFGDTLEIRKDDTGNYTVVFSNSSSIVKYSGIPKDRIKYTIDAYLDYYSALASVDLPVTQDYIDKLNFLMSSGKYSSIFDAVKVLVKQK